jgi:uncharacterized integral membrane protein
MSDERPNSPRPRDNAVPQRQRREPPWRLAVALVSGVLLVVVLVQNSTPSTVHLLWLSVTMNLWILLLCCFILGVLVGLVVPGVAKRVKSGKGKK